MTFAPELAGRIVADVAVRIERARTPVPIGVSNRHLHLSREHWEALFGKGVEPRKYRQIRQPGFYACHEMLDIEGPKGRLKGLRLVAPHRPQTQVEVSRTDALALGLDPPVRGSGKLTGAVGVRIIGPKGGVEVQDALIISQRHLHLHPQEAQALKVKDGDSLRLRAGKGGPRETVFENVLARVSDQFALELHLDTDEANASWVKSGDLAYIV